VVDQTNILSILPAPTVGGFPLSGDIADLGDSTFQNYMKDAVRESSANKENDSSPKNEPAERASSAESNRPDRADNRAADV